MKTNIIALFTAVCFGGSLVAFAAPPPPKKPGPTVVVPVPVPVPVVPARPRPPVVAPVPPKPVGPAVRFCGVERAHAAHNFRLRGILYRCPGKVLRR